MDAVPYRPLPIDQSEVRYEHDPTGSVTADAHTGADALDGGRVCLLVTGVPGAGKTTVADRLARSLSRSAILNGDLIARLVVGGYV